MGAPVKFHGVKKHAASPRGSRQTPRTWRRVEGTSRHRRDPCSLGSPCVRKPAWLQVTRGCGDPSAGDLEGWRPEAPGPTLKGSWKLETALQGQCPLCGVGWEKALLFSAHTGVGAGGLGVCCAPLSDSVNRPPPHKLTERAGKTQAATEPRVT